MATCFNHVAIALCGHVPNLGTYEHSPRFRMFGSCPATHCRHGTLYACCARTNAGTSQRGSWRGLGFILYRFYRFIPVKTNASSMISQIPSRAWKKYCEMAKIGVHRHFINQRFQYCLEKKMQKFQNLGGWRLAIVCFHQGTDFYLNYHRTTFRGLDVFSV